VNDLAVDCLGHTQAHDCIGESLTDSRDSFIATSEKIVHRFDLHDVTEVILWMQANLRMVHRGCQRHVEHDQTPNCVLLG
jgi:hypothetical protein